MAEVKVMEVILCIHLGRLQVFPTETMPGKSLQFMPNPRLYMAKRSLPPLMLLTQI
jgi:hypothetical protein